MNAIRKFFASLRVFKRLRVLEANTLIALQAIAELDARITDIESFVDSREPCGSCGHHRYRQKTLHYDGCPKRAA